jgi:outer membrane lipoprotein-sorting protein
MSNAPRWSAASLPVSVDGRPRAELTALSPGGFTLDELFTFMRDAELRFETLRMRIEERRATSRGEELRIIDVTLRHPGLARVSTSDPALGTAGNYDLWITDGETVRTYAAPHRLGRQRHVRREVQGLRDDDLPGASRVYRPLTALPKETLPETFVHPAGFCQNVLATGRCGIAGTDTVAGREAILLECDHPRSIELAGDRPDYRLSIAVDRETGVIARLVESVGDRVTRHAEVVSLLPNAVLPPAAFEFSFPDGTTFIY